MLKRMVIGLPRSGTTWAANWLTYDGEVCVHDPLYFKHYNEWDATYDAVSCTGIYDWPEFVAAQKCPVLVLHRPMGEVRASLLEFDTRSGGAWLPWDAEERLHRLNSEHIMHLHWRNLFKADVAAQVWRFLQMPSQFDAVRHNELRRMRIQPRYERPFDADGDLHARLMAELRERKARDNAGAGG